MKVLVALLDYDRHTYTDQVVRHNIMNAGHYVEMITINEKGISRSINLAIEKAQHYDAVFTMANDILMPLGWLQKSVEAAQAIPHTGVAALYCVQHRHVPAIVNDIQVYPGEIVFGNALYPKSVLESVGHMNEDYDPYGMQDSDYCHRAWMNGFINYYVDVPASEHIGHDVGDDTPYRRMKDAGLSKCPDKWMKWTNLYQQSGRYSIFYDKYNYPKK